MQLLLAMILLLLLLLLLPISCRKTAGMVVLVTATVAALVVPLVITLVYHLPPSQLPQLLSSEVSEYQRRMMLTPWCRAGPWVVGVWAALLLHYTDSHNINIPKCGVLTGYLVCTAVVMALLGGLYPYNHVWPTRHYTRAVAASYGTLARPSWALCMAWIVFTCHTHHAEVVNQLLSYAAWWPLSRLSFTVYLVGPVVQVWCASVQLTPVYFNYLSKLFECLGVLFISTVLSLVLCCLLERPISSLATALLPYQGML
nr:O-acyltransferase like protein-like [Cherax quadricarinatus]